MEATPEADSAQLCSNCGSVMIEEDGQLVCPNCHGEIDWGMDED